MNLDACKIISRNFRILHDNITTTNILRKPPRAKSLKDLLVRSSLPRNLPNHPTDTFPCNRTVCRTCPHINSSATITTPKGHVTITGHFTCITDNVIYCLTCDKCPSTFRNSRAFMQLNDALCAFFISVIMILGLSNHSARINLSIL